MFIDGESSSDRDSTWPSSVSSIIFGNLTSTRTGRCPPRQAINSVRFFIFGDHVRDIDVSIVVSIDH